MEAVDDDGRCISVSAPGKVLIAGGYLVLERPNVGVVLAATARFHSSIKWSLEKVPSNLPTGAGGSGRLPHRLCIKVESPQFRSVNWYACVFHNHRLPELVPSSPQTSNLFVERTLAYVLGYLFQSGCADEFGGGNFMKMPHDEDVEERVLAIKLRGDNDFYSQISQLRERGLPYTSESLATLPPFLECPIGSDGQLVVSKTGMGSSAALVTSLVGALLSFFGAAKLPCFDDLTGAVPDVLENSWPTDDGSVRELLRSLDLTHNLAQICHCVAQGKVGSGFDVSAGVYGTHIYTRFSPSALSGALSADEKSAASHGWISSPDSDITETHLERVRRCANGPGGWDAHRKQLQLPPCFRMLMGDVCGGSSTPSMVRKVLAWRKDSSTAAGAEKMWSILGATNLRIAELLNAIANEATSAGTEGKLTFDATMKVLSAFPSSEWTHSKVDRSIETKTLTHLMELRDAFSCCRRLLREMGEGAGVPIEPPEQTKLVDATCAVPGVLCAGVPGAGGVDAVFAIVIQPNVADGVQELWGSWRTGGDSKDVKSQGEPSLKQGFVCPLTLAASAGGPQGGAFCTRSLSWE